MASESDIKVAIEMRVKSKYSIWTIGVTDDPERRKTEHTENDDTKYWKQWDADSETAARNVEKHFLDKGMKGGGGGGGSADYVYIF